MNVRFADRIKQTSYATGIGDFLLSPAAIGGFRKFSDMFPSGTKVCYGIIHNNDWEIGVGNFYLSGPDAYIAREIILQSSNSNSIVNFSTGEKFVICQEPAALIGKSDVNLLINGGFDIFQRTDPTVATSVADDVYGPDRWNILTQSAAITVERSTGNFAKNCLKMIQANASPQRFGAMQIVEHYESFAFRGKEMRFQCYVKCSNAQPIRVAILEWTGTAGAVTSDVVNDWTSGTFSAGNFFLGSNLSVTATTSVTPLADTWTLASVNGLISNSCNHLIVMVWTEGQAAQNIYLNVSEASLKEGYFPHSWNPRHYADEYRLCRRYCQVYSASAQYQYFASGFSNSGTTASFLMILDSAMRAAPTATFSTVGNFGMRNNGSQIACTAIIHDTTLPTNDRIVINTTGSATSIGQGNVLDAVNSSAKITLTAEL